MVKKAITETIPKSKKNQAKRKKMFNQFPTHQQEIIERQEAKSHHNKLEFRQQGRYQEMNDEGSEEQMRIESLNTKNSSLNEVCDAVNKLFAKNKINVKNAFQIPIIDLQNLPAFQQTTQNDYAWKRLSSTLENDYKIYGYRVDAIHNIAYSMLNNINRRNQDLDSLNQPKNLIQKQGENQEMKIQKANGDASQDAIHLQKNKQNLNLAQYELAFGVDPILERVRRQFDHSGLSSMLLNNLSIDETLSLILVDKKDLLFKKVPNNYGQYKEDTWYIDNPLKIFNDIQKITNIWNDQKQVKKQNDYYLKMYQQTEKKLFQFQSHTSKPYQVKLKHQMIDENMPQQKNIDDVIKLKKKKHNTIEMNFEDDERQLQQLNKLIKSKQFKKINQTLIQQQRLKREDYLNFNIDDSMEEPKTQPRDTRQNVFKKQNLKQQGYQQVEDKFLVPIKPFHHFTITKIMTLRQEPEQLLIQNIKNINQPEKQIDIRRQQVSIKQTKEKILHLIEDREEKTFRTIYDHYHKRQKSISPALCFLTILHLANQNNYSLVQDGKNNFYLK